MLPQDKVAVIYGAGGAIGALAAEGATLFLTRRHRHRSKLSPTTSLPPADPPRRPRSTELLRRRLLREPLPGHDRAVWRSAAAAR